MIVIAGESAMHLMSDEKTFDALESASQSALGSWSRARIGDIDELREYGIFATKADPLHVLVGSKDDRIQSERVVSHIWSSRLPGGSLCHLAPGVAVTSPEFCYLLAGRRGIAPAAAVGMEACGAYGKDGSSRGFADRKAISSLASLKSYLDGARGCRGRQGRPVRPGARGRGVTLSPRDKDHCPVDCPGVTRWLWNPVAQKQLAGLACRQRTLALL